jgi:hypothetical protein
MRWVDGVGTVEVWRDGNNDEKERGGGAGMWGTLVSSPAAWRAEEWPSRAVGGDGEGTS